MRDGRIHRGAAGLGLTIVVAVLGAGVGACSGGNADGAAEPSAGFPVTIEHKFGTTEIESEPERVVSVGYNEQDFLLALGVAPVGVREWFGEQPGATWPWAQDELAGAEPEVLASAELDFEQIAALRPDLIVGPYSGITEDEYAKLSRIAPTVAQSDEFVEFGIPWQEETLLIGRALGREAQARELVDEIEARFARVRAEHPEFRRATAVVAYEAEAGGFGAWSSADPRGRFLRALGFRPAAKIDELAGDSYYTEISAERLRMLDRDVLVMLNVPNAAASREELLAEPLFRRLDVVRERRDIYPDRELAAALSFASPLSLPQAIDGLVPQLAAAAERMNGRRGAEAG